MTPVYNLYLFNNVGSIYIKFTICSIIILFHFLFQFLLVSILNSTISAAAIFTPYEKCNLAFSTCIIPNTDQLTNQYFVTFFIFLLLLIHNYQSKLTELLHYVSKRK